MNTPDMAPTVVLSNDKSHGRRIDQAMSRTPGPQFAIGSSSHSAVEPSFASAKTFLLPVKNVLTNSSRPYREIPFEEQKQDDTRALRAIQIEESVFVGAWLEF